jgi:hypothetical protein
MQDVFLQHLVHDNARARKLNGGRVHFCVHRLTAAIGAGNLNLCGIGGMSHFPLWGCGARIGEALAMSCLGVEEAEREEEKCEAFGGGWGMKLCVKVLTELSADACGDRGGAGAVGGPVQREVHSP